MELVLILDDPIVLHITMEDYLLLDTRQSNDQCVDVPVPVRFCGSLYSPVLSPTEDSVLTVNAGKVERRNPPALEQFA